MEPRTLMIRLLALAALVMIVAGGFQPAYVRIYIADREALGRHLTEVPYGQLPGFRSFMLEVRRQTERGDRIAFWMPEAHWERGYGYAHTRAGYLLPGRRMVPLLEIDRQDRVENLEHADFIACWHCEPPFPGFESIAVSEHGVLARRAPAPAAAPGELPAAVDSRSHTGEPER